MIYVLESLGFAFFADPGQTAVEPAQTAPVPSHQPAVQRFVTSAQPRSDGHKAYLDMTGDGYVLRADSLINANPTDRASARKVDAGFRADAAQKPRRSSWISYPGRSSSLPANVRKLRAQLVAENALVPQEGCPGLTKNLAFTSPSPASALVKGRNSTGHGGWIRTTDRKRLGEVLLEPREKARGSRLSVLQTLDPSSVLVRRRIKRHISGTRHAPHQRRNQPSASSSPARPSLPAPPDTNV